jgi:hypothetical protein
MKTLQYSKIEFIFTLLFLLISDYKWCSDHLCEIWLCVSLACGEVILDSVVPSVCNIIVFKNKRIVPKGSYGLFLTCKKN